MGWSDPIDLYCERTSAAFWAEPVNALTNVAFLIAALAAWWIFRRKGGTDVFVLVLIALAATVGVGSFAFHTLATRGAMWLDVIPIALFVHAYLLFALIRFVGLRIDMAIGAVAGFLVASRALSAALPSGFANGSGEYLPVLAALIAVGFLARVPRDRWTIQLAAGVFAISLGFRSIDLAICREIPFGTHFIWHLLNAAVVYLLLSAAAVAHVPPQIAALSETVRASDNDILKVAVAIICVLVLLHVLPLLRSHAEQDDCAFGPVSNARYRELLAEAKRRQKERWPPLLWDNEISTSRLTERFNELSQGMTSADERLAAMHAVIRALGGEFRSITDTRSWSQAVSYEYRLDVNRLGFFRPIWRQMRISAEMMVGDPAASSLGPPRLRRGDILIRATFPGLFEGDTEYEFSACPRVLPASPPGSPQ